MYGKRGCFCNRSKTIAARPTVSNTALNTMSVFKRTVIDSGSNSIPERQVTLFASLWKLTGCSMGNLILKFHKLPGTRQ